VLEKDSMPLNIGIFPSSESEETHKIDESHKFASNGLQAVEESGTGRQSEFDLQLERHQSIT
jgi:hypothetical protein